MLIPNYANTFEFSINDVTKETVLTFFNTMPKLEGENIPKEGLLEANPATERHEVSKVVMTEFNLRDLADKLENMFNLIDKAERKEKI